METVEYLDIFNENMEATGVASRDEVHSKGLWHQTFQCWLMREDVKNNKKYVLFQRRSPHKIVYPNLLDITAAGHIMSGETAEEGIRELEEELGVKADFANLIYLGIRVEVAIIGNVFNREFCNTYFYPSNLPLNDYTLQLNEVTSLVEIEISDGLKLFNGEISSVTARGFEVTKDNIKREIEISVGLGDIVPRNLDKYYLKVFVMAERYFNGKIHLMI